MTKGMAAVAAVLFIGACGKKDAGDNCQRMIDKSMPVFEKMGKEGGKTFGPKEKEGILKACREAEKEGKGKEDMQCVLDAKDQAAVEACYAAAFGDYQKKGKKSEAQLQLNKLMKNAKVAYITDGEFPKGSVPLTPAEDCCFGAGSSEGKCAVNTDAWTKNPVWAELDFQIDEPHRFRYSYESDGKTVTAQAVGDLDCDKTAITYTLKGHVETDMPVFELSEPDPSAD